LQTVLNSFDDTWEGEGGGGDGDGGAVAMNTIMKRINA
jgi:hypothetical protein